MEQKVIEVEGKRVRINPAPATVGYDVALRLREAVGGSEKKSDPKEMQDCLYEMLRFCEIDLGDGRWAKLDSKDFVNQHFKKPQSIVELQSALMEVNFGFLADNAHSVS